MKPCNQNIACMQFPEMYIPKEEFLKMNLRWILVNLVNKNSKA